MDVDPGCIYRNCTQEDPPPNAIVLSFEVRGDRELLREALEYIVDSVSYEETYEDLAIYCDQDELSPHLVLKLLREGELGGSAIVRVIIGQDRQALYTGLLDRYDMFVPEAADYLRFWVDSFRILPSKNEVLH